MLIHEAVDKGFIAQEANTRKLLQGPPKTHFTAGFQRQNHEFHSGVEAHISSLDGRMCNVEADVETQV